MLAGCVVVGVLYLQQIRTLAADGLTNQVTTVGVPLDDVYIHCRYAENLFNGHGYCFNPEDKFVTADTSPLWVVLLAATGFFGSHYEIAAVLLSALFFVCIAPITYRIVRGELALPQRWAVITAVLVLMAGRLMWSALSGMEITLAVLLTLLIFQRHLRTVFETHTMTKTEALLLGLAIAVRPELMLLAALCFADAIIRRGKLKRLVSLWIPMLIFFVSIVPVFLLPLIESGTLTYHSSKVQGAHLSFLPNIAYLGFAARILLISISPPVLFALIAPFFVRKRGMILLWLFALGLPLILAFVAPQFRHHGRYFFPVMPICIILGIMMIQQVVENRHRTMQSVIQTVLIVYAGISSVIWTRQYGESVSNIVSQHVSSSHWIDDHIPKDNVIAAHDVGALGYITKRSIIDLVGLVTPSMYPIQDDQRRVWQEARRNGAEYFLIYTRLNPMFYEYAKDSLELVRQWSVKLPLVASADTTLSLFHLRTK
jgi:hypothetical protein